MRHFQDEEHRQVLAKLRIVIELTEMLIGVAENNTNAIAMLMENNARRTVCKRTAPSEVCVTLVVGVLQKEQSTDAYRRAEQLILYVKVMHIISSSLVMAQRHRDSATLQPSPAVQLVLNQLNNTYHQCLVSGGRQKAAESATTTTLLLLGALTRTRIARRPKRHRSDDRHRVRRAHHVSTRDRLVPIGRNGRTRRQSTAVPEAL